MGTGFTIDTCLNVARYGIHSVISLGDDELIERVRKYHSAQHGLQYNEIAAGSDGYRARRITAYLNQLDLLVKTQFDLVRKEPFEQGGDITRYFELLPEGRLKGRYRKMIEEPDLGKKDQLQIELRHLMKSGRIDVNIMKLT